MRRRVAVLLLAVATFAVFAAPGEATRARPCPSTAGHRWKGGDSFTIQSLSTTGNLPCRLLGRTLREWVTDTVGRARHLTAPQTFGFARQRLHEGAFRILAVFAGNADIYIGPRSFGATRQKVTFTADGFPIYHCDSALSAFAASAKSRYSGRVRLRFRWLDRRPCPHHNKAPDRDRSSPPHASVCTTFVGPLVGYSPCNHGLDEPGTDRTGQEIDIRRHEWSFGDGTSSVVTDSGSGDRPDPHLCYFGHGYASPGTYTIKVRIVDALGRSDTASTTVQATKPVPPPESLSISPTTSSDRNVSFSGFAGGTCPVASYRWDFGDGSTGSGSQPSHAYATSGRYTVRLTATDVLGHASNATQDIVIDTGPPVASFTVDHQTGSIGAGTATFTFTDTSTDDSGIRQRVWNFGDNSDSGTGAQVSHSFTAPGQYTVGLAVSDPANNVSYVEQTVTVDP